jgi:hypothetical protein
MMNRLIYSLGFGAILGVVCIIGASLRMPNELSSAYLFGFWYNRLLMGLVIGLFTRPHAIKVAVLRGIILGGVVSFAFYSSTEFFDLTGFLAGIVYGIIIELALFFVIKNK